MTPYYMPLAQTLSSAHHTHSPYWMVNRLFTICSMKPNTSLKFKMSHNNLSIKSLNYSTLENQAKISILPSFLSEVHIIKAGELALNCFQVSHPLLSTYSLVQESDHILVRHLGLLNDLSTNLSSIPLYCYWEWSLQITISNTLLPGSKVSEGSLLPIT